MDNILNITNGDCAVAVMRKANIPGVFLPWRDVLHDGPVPGHVSLEALSRVRAEFISSRGWGELGDIDKEFIERDNSLKSFEKYEKVILWFEHDLYDQLQILQILDWFYKHNNHKNNLSIICADKYLGQLPTDEMRGMLSYEEPVTDRHLSLSHMAWSAYCASSPQQWNELLRTDTCVLPFLKAAVLRQLEEFPSKFNGLSRTAQQLLEIISEGEIGAWKAFALNQGAEDRVFLGDSSFWAILQSMLNSKAVLLDASKGGISQAINAETAKGCILSITPTGEDVLSGKRNWLDITPPDYWLGGVHMQADNIWCWNSELCKIEKCN
ncbi:hypothetical protein MNBD_GAMMA09-1706 [hydrothermal vent metagenome]|uniref:DUF1835 domain-containing protein n=1 Tax=hydrothermal vent metagenome TaxID=652676 RepID=A0A3B0Y736_9ZZZZ